jgi:hypothetical protein
MAQVTRARTGIFNQEHHNKRELSGSVKSEKPHSAAGLVLVALGVFFS